jgi:hypothetical protein
MFASKAGTYPSEASFRCHCIGWAPGLTHKHNLDWKGLPGTNTLAFYNYSFTGVKRFIRLGRASLLETIEYLQLSKIQRNLRRKRMTDFKQISLFKQFKSK